MRRDLDLDPEPSQERSQEQRLIANKPYRQQWRFWQRQAEGNTRSAWRHLREQWRERDKAAAQNRPSLLSKITLAVRS